MTNCQHPGQSKVSEKGTEMTERKVMKTSQLRAGDVVEIMGRVLSDKHIAAWGDTDSVAVRGVVSSTSRAEERGRPSYVFVGDPLTGRLYQCATSWGAQCARIVEDPTEEELLCAVRAVLNTVVLCAKYGEDFARTEKKRITKKWRDMCRSLFPKNEAAGDALVGLLPNWEGDNLFELLHAAETL